MVERYQKVKVKYYDENFELKTKSFKNFEAILIQHEYDHFDGILFFDRMNDTQLNRIHHLIKKIERGDLPKMEYGYMQRLDNKKK